MRVALDDSFERWWSDQADAESTAVVAKGPTNTQPADDGASARDAAEMVAPDQVLAAAELLTRYRDGAPGAPPPILSCHLAAAWSCDEADGPWPGAPAAFRAELVDYLAAWHRLMVASEHGLADTFDHADPLTAAVDDALARCVARLPAGDQDNSRRLEDLAIGMWREWCSARRTGHPELVAAALRRRAVPTPPTPPAREGAVCGVVGDGLARGGG